MQSTPVLDAHKFNDIHKKVKNQMTHDTE